MVVGLGNVPRAIEAEEPGQHPVDQLLGRQRADVGKHPADPTIAHGEGGQLNGGDELRRSRNEGQCHRTGKSPGDALVSNRLCDGQPTGQQHAEGSPLRVSGDHHHEGRDASEAVPTTHHSTEKPGQPGHRVQHPEVEGVGGEEAAEGKADRPEQRRQWAPIQSAKQPEHAQARPPEVKEDAPVQGNGIGQQCPEQHGRQVEHPRLPVCHEGEAAGDLRGPQRNPTGKPL